MSLSLQELVDAINKARFGKVLLLDQSPKCLSKEKTGYPPRWYPQPTGCQRASKEQMNGNLYDTSRRNSYY
jgi:hypothetical protein